MYFRNFPKVLIKPSDDRFPITMTDTTRRVRFLDFVKNNYVVFDFYDVKDGETPEYIAHEYYGDSNLHWIILLSNNIVDIYTDWPKRVADFEQYVKNKYNDPYGTHHWEIPQESGDTTKMIEIPNESANTIPVDAIEVTNTEYEEILDNQRRRIRLVQPRFITQIKNEFIDKIKR